jgi:arsenite methyltransferase
VTVDLTPVDLALPAVAESCDELPLWSAPFALMLLDRIPMRAGHTMLDVGAGTGFLTLGLAQRCGPQSTVFTVDTWATRSQS